MKPIFESLASFRSCDSILLLGATGLFGRHLLPVLINFFDQSISPTPITIVTRNKSRFNSSFPKLQRPYIKIIEHDFSIPGSLNIDTPPTHILHMANTSAADTFKSVSQYEKYLLLLNSAQSLIPLLSSHRTARVVFTSSGVAYGPNSDYSESTISSVDHLSPSSSLAFGKLTSEYILSHNCNKLSIDISIARCFSFISPFIPLDVHYAIGNFISSALNNRDIIIRTDGNDIRSYQHVHDAVSWLLFLLTTDSPPRILNIGSDIPISIRDLAQLVRSILNPSINIQILNELPLDHNLRRSYYVPELNLAYSLGLVNNISLQSAIEHFLG